jgi:hypothetical protein
MRRVWSKINEHKGRGKSCSNGVLITPTEVTRRGGQECGFFTGVKNFDQNFEHNNSGEVNTGRSGRGKMVEI